MPETNVEKLGRFLKHIWWESKDEVWGNVELLQTWLKRVGKITEKNDYLIVEHFEGKTRNIVSSKTNIIQFGQSRNLSSKCSRLDKAVICHVEFFRGLWQVQKRQVKNPLRRAVDVRPIDS